MQDQSRSKEATERQSSASANARTVKTVEQSSTRMVRQSSASSVNKSKIVKCNAVV